MKIKLLYFTFLLFLVTNASAQTAVTATWSLLANATGVGTGGLVPANQTLGSAISGTVYGSSFATSGWQRSASTVNLPTSYNANSYIEYNVTVPSGKKLNLTSISFQALGGGTSGVKFAVYYSLNGFLASSSVGPISYNGATNANNTGAGAVTALNTSTTPLTGQEVATISPNIEVGQDKTLTIRIYVWAGSVSKYFASKNFALGGTLSDDAAPVLEKFALTTSLSDNNAGVIARTPNNTQYDSGESVSLTATANFGYKFVKWVDAANGDAELSTNSTYLVTMNSAKNIKAVFTTVTTYNFTLNRLGSNWGEVQLSPQPTGGKYEAGTEVTMTVISNKVTTFSYWEDNSTALQRVITVNSDVTYTATFDEIPFIVGWDFKDQNVKSNKPGDFYSESTNVGLISIYKPDNTAINWLSSPSSFSPAYPCFRLWATGANFSTERRYVKASFGTTGYKNIQIKSLVSANYQAYSVQKLQYSLDDVTYTDLASVDITSVYNSAWTNLNATLPAEAEGQTRVYLKWIADTSSPILGNSVDNDGTAYTNIFVYADKEIVNDVTPPTLVSTVPASESSTATVNGAVVLTFDEKMKLGSGGITLTGKTLSPVFGSKTVSLAYEKLSYNSQYTVNIPSGALTDQSGNPFAGITFTFTTGNRIEPTKKLFDAVVATDGSGDYTTVTAAIGAAPTGRTTPWLIYIKNGKYTGHHDIPSTKPFIHLIGQSRDDVVISDNRLSGGDNAYHVSLGATMVVNSTDCYFENLTLENSIGYENLTGPQALALYAVTNHFTTNNCWLRSYQDTYLTAYSSMYDRQYLKNTKIEGAVDYIYGGGDVFFDKCTLTNNRADGGYIVAPSHKAGTLWGYVFSNCTIDQSPRITSGSNYFGRPWQNSPKTVFLNTTLKSGIKPTGWWEEMGAIPAVFADYNTMDANGNPVDLSQRISNYKYNVKDANGNVTSTVTGTAKSSLTDAEAATYTYENVILRNGDTWDPRMMTEAPEAPSVVTQNGSSLSWNSVPYSRLYIVFRNNSVLGFTINNAYTDATAINGQAYNYAVQAVGEFGALSAATPAATVLPVTGLQLKAERKPASVLVSWTSRSEQNTSHFVVERSEDGTSFHSIGEVKATGNSSVQNKYSFSDTYALNEAVYYRVKAIDFNGVTTNSNISLVKGLEQDVLLLYPTITTGSLTVVYPKASTNSTLKVYNLSGIKVLSIKAENNSTRASIDVSGLASGAYILIYSDGRKVLTSKFINQ